MAPVIDWDLLISLLRQNEHPVDSLVITSPSYIKLTSALIAKTDIKTIQYHFMNNLILSVIGALSSDLSAPMNNMTLHISGGKALPSRQDLCIQNTNTVLGQIVGRFYVLASFSQAAKDSVDELVNRLRRSLEQSIKQLEFFDDITRKTALDKVDYMKICGVISKYAACHLLLDVIASKSSSKNWIWYIQPRCHVARFTNCVLPICDDQSWTFFRKLHLLSSMVS